MEKTGKATNLMQGLLEECNRVREIIKEYERPELNSAGALAAMMMKQSIENAEEAMGVGDAIAMLMAYEDLKRFEGS